MPSDQESLTLDGLAINDGTAFDLEKLTISPPPKRLDWIESADSDGAVLAEAARHERRTIEAQIRPVRQATQELSLDKLGQIVDKLQKAPLYDAGIPLAWTPNTTSRTLTFDVLNGEVVDMPVELDGDDAGWLLRWPVIRVRFDCRPFGHKAEAQLQLTDEDTFSRDTNAEGRWAMDASTFVITGGQVTIASNAERRAYRTRLTMEDGTVGLGHTAGGRTDLRQFGLTAKRLDVSNEIRGRITYNGGGVGNASYLEIAKYDAAVETVLATSTTFDATTTAAPYPNWLMLTLAGNVVTVNFYDADPWEGGAVVKTLSHTLAGADATKFGDGIWGNVGWRFSGTQPNNWTADNWRVDAPELRSTEPLYDFLLYGILGDVPAEGRIVLTDGATQNRAHAEVGLEHREFDRTNPGPVIIDSDQMITSGYAGTQTTQSGSYDPGASGNNVIQATLATSPVGVCALPSQPHVGAFRPKLRCYASTADVYVRLAYRVGQQGSWSRTAFARVPAAAAFYELALDEIVIGRVAAGTHSWEGVIEAYADTGGATVKVDYCELIPAQSYARARAPFTFDTPIIFVARSGFLTESGVVTGDTLDDGTNVWTNVTGGDATDFDAAGGVMTRTSTSDSPGGRYITAGTTDRSDVVVAVDIEANAMNDDVSLAVLARVDDVNEFCFLSWVPGESANTNRLYLRKVVAGVPLTISSWPVTWMPNNRYRLQLAVLGGWWVVSAGSPGSVAQIDQGLDSDLANLVALQTGMVGIGDVNGGASACTRTYDNFAAWVPSLDQVCFSTRTLQFRHDDTVRENSGGTSTGRVRQPRGGRIYLPPYGDAQKPIRVAAKMRRNDVEGELPDDQIADELRVTAYANERRLLVPRT